MCSLLGRVPHHQLGNSVHRYFMQTGSFLICVYLCSRRIGEHHQSTLFRSCRGLSYFSVSLYSKYIGICWVLLMCVFGFSYYCYFSFTLVCFCCLFCGFFFLLLLPERGLSVALLSTLHQKLYKVKAMEELWIGGP